MNSYNSQITPSQPPAIEDLASYQDFTDFIAVQTCFENASATRTWNLLANLSIFAVTGKLDPLVSRVTQEAGVQPFMYNERRSRFDYSKPPLLDHRVERRDFQFTTVDTTMLADAMAKRDKIKQYGVAENSYDIVDLFLICRAFDKSFHES